MVPVKFAVIYNDEFVCLFDDEEDACEYALVSFDASDMGVAVFVVTIH